MRSLCRHTADEEREAQTLSGIRALLSTQIFKWALFLFIFYLKANFYNLKANSHEKHNQIHSRIILGVGGWGVDIVKYGFAVILIKTWGKNDPEALNTPYYKNRVVSDRL